MAGAAETWLRRSYPVFRLCVGAYSNIADRYGWDFSLAARSGRSDPHVAAAGFRRRLRALKEGTEMKEINVSQMAVCLRHACAQIVSHESELTAIDTVIGDGDHGTGMKLGFSRLDAMLQQNSFCDMQTLLRSSGLELVKTMGGASGVIFGSLLIGGCAACAEKTVLDAQALTAVFTDAADSISRRGGAKRGDKTMLDALLGAVDAMQAAEGGDIEAVLQAAQTGAETGAEATGTCCRDSAGRKIFGIRRLGIRTQALFPPRSSSEGCGKDFQNNQIRRFNYGTLQGD